MDGTIHFECDRYRQDLAYVRSRLALKRIGPDMCIRLIAGIPHTSASTWVDVFLSRKDVWIVGFRNEKIAAKFEDTNPVIPGVSITRTIPYSPNYTILGAWTEGLSVNGPPSIYNSILALQTVTRNNDLGRTVPRALVFVIFAVSEALRFWEIDKAISQTICDSRPFRYIDWKEKVNNWGNLSGSDQQGARMGVQLPAV